MRKLALILAALLLCITAAAAETNFDTTQYTEEELREIRAAIDAALARKADEPETMVLYDQDGLYVEYRGLVERDFDPTTYYVSLFVDNATGETVYLGLGSCRANRAQPEIRNSGFTVPQDTMYLTVTLNSFIIDIGTVTDYGIDCVTDLEFTIFIERGEEEVSIPLSFTDLQLPTHE